MKDVVAKVLKGDKDAFREVVTTFGPEVRAYLASSISDYQAVDDLAQETFIATYNSLEKFDPDADLRAWIYGIARNKVRMYLRRFYQQKDRMFLMSQEVMEQLTLILENDGDELDNVRIENLTVCIERLPEKSKTLIQSRYFSRTTVIEIANKLQITENAVSATLYRVRAALRKCMEGEARV